MTDPETPAEAGLGATDTIRRLKQIIAHLASAVDEQGREQQKLAEVRKNINAGFRLGDVLSLIYTEFKQLIPFNRLGFALIEQENGVDIVRSHWAQSDREITGIKPGYAAPLAGSSLEGIIRSQRPRIINDLHSYLAANPSSHSTRLIISEGARSSLTCPLLINNKPVGFLFFTSLSPDTYAQAHLEYFERIAAEVSYAVEKARLVSELELLTAEIQKQNEELLALNKVRSEFLGMAAHDLRGPLGHNQLVCELLLDPAGRLTEAQRLSFIRDIHGKSIHMLQLVSNILDVTQIESGKLVLQREAIALNALLEEAAHYHTQLASPKNTKVIVSPCPPLTVTADPLRLRQILDNFISNAVKYSPPGSIVTVSAEDTRPGCRVVVKDEGPGIAEADRAKLFQDFSRLSNRPTGGERSTGLGLAISKRLIEAHEGSIGVDSTPGEGSSFWFRLP